MCNWQHTVSTGRDTRPTARWVRGSRWRYVLWNPQGLSPLPTRLSHQTTRRHMRIPPPHPIFHTLTRFMSSNPRLAQDVSLSSKRPRLAMRPPASYSKRTGIPNLGESSRVIRLTIHLHKGPRLWMRGAIRLLHLYAFITWIGTTLPLTFQLARIYDAISL
jgi:hypothetical protein